MTSARFLSALGIWVVVFGRAAAQVVALGMTQTHQASLRRIRKKLPSRNPSSRLGFIHWHLFPTEMVKVGSDK